MRSVLLSRSLARRAAELPQWRIVEAGPDDVPVPLRVVGPSQRGREQRHAAAPADATAAAGESGAVAAAAVGAGSAGAAAASTHALEVCIEKDGLLTDWPFLFWEDDPKRAAQCASNAISSDSDSDALE